MKKQRIPILIISLKQCFVEKKKKETNLFTKTLLNFFILLNCVWFHFLLHEKPLHAIVKGISVCSLAHQTSSSFLFKKIKIVLIYFANRHFFFNTWHQKSNTTSILSKLKPLSQCQDQLLAPLVISLHPPLGTVGFSFVSSSYNGNGTEVSYNVGQFIKTLSIFFASLSGYIYTLNQWLSKIK
jgi:hypothetical protein